MSDLVDLCPELISGVEEVHRRGNFAAHLLFQVEAALNIIVTPSHSSKCSYPISKNVPQLSEEIFVRLHSVSHLQESI